MKRAGKVWKRTGLAAGAVLAVLSAVVYVSTYTGTNIYPDLGKRHAMLRLEDVGPGGDYDTPDGLGKLRAVMEYLETEEVPFHVAVIPRRISMEPGGAWEERGIDDPEPDPIVTGFIGILKEAEQRGGVLGMHGYTHQYGDSARPDGGQISGTGVEFKVPGVPETKSASYAAERITDSLAAFAKAGLHPAFWESPHYKDTREQEKVFRSFMGILYEPDLFSLRSFKDLNTYTSLNTYGADSLGSVYVPAPYRYVTDGASVDAILRKAEKGDGLASMYLHPFLEFSYMEEETGADGKPLIRDGLPIYRYKAQGPPSYLHRLVDGMRGEGYRWMSLYDVVPFSPAHRVTLTPGTEASQVMLGDVTGSGHADVIVREPHRLLVVPGTYDWPRNRPQQAAEVWLKGGFAAEDKLLPVDLTGDGRADIVAYNPQTGELRIARSDGRRFEAPVSLGRLPAGLTGMQPFTKAGTERGLIAESPDGELLSIRRNGAGDGVLTETVGRSGQAGNEVHAGSFDETAGDDLVIAAPGQATPMLLRGRPDGTFAKPEPIENIGLKVGDQLLAGDTNGDGRDDLIVYTPSSGVWRVYENNGQGIFKALDNDFGPWAAGIGIKAFGADMDGNGRMDIGAYNAKNHVLDFALSFRGRTS